MSNESLSFREVQMTDAPSLVMLMEQLGYSIEASNMKENIQNYIQIANQKAWVAEKSGQIVGCIAGAITHSFHLPGSFLRVITLVVDKQQRRSGIGKILMDLAEKFALSQGCSYIELTSATHRSASHEFYHSLGFCELNNTKKYFSKKL